MIENIETISLQEYQKIAGTTDMITEEQFKNNHYYILGLCGESAELLEKVHLIFSQHKRGITPSYDMLKGAALEAGDVAWYAVRELKALEGSPTESTNPIEQAQMVLPYEIKLNPDSLLNETIELCELAGACSDITKKMIRDNGNRFSGEIVGSLRANLYSIINSIIVVSSTLGFRVSQILGWNADKLASRMMRDKIHGSGDER